MSRIAEKFDTSTTTIRLIVDPAYKKRQLQQSNEINKARYKEDEKYREYIRQNSNEVQKERYWKDKDYRKCKNLQTQQWHKFQLRNNPQEYREKMRQATYNHYLNNREEYAQRAKEWARTHKEQYRETRRKYEARNR